MIEVRIHDGNCEQGRDEAEVTTLGATCGCMGRRRAALESALRELRKAADAVLGNQCKANMSVLEIATREAEAFEVRP